MTFEHEYILRVLNSYALDLETSKNQAEVTDKCACILTAFMQGQVVQALKEKTK